MNYQTIPKCEHLVLSHLDAGYEYPELRYEFPDGHEEYLCELCAAQNGFCHACGEKRDYSLVICEKHGLIIECDDCTGEYFHDDPCWQCESED